MSKVQIPIYRAKKIDSDEYVEGVICSPYSNEVIASKVKFYLNGENNYKLPTEGYIARNIDKIISDLGDNIKEKCWVDNTIHDSFYRRYYKLTSNKNESWKYWRLDNGNKFTEKLYILIENESGWVISDEEYTYEEAKSGIKYNLIDPSTLAINFPDMIDSEGNKIFASLSEDGKGGDILEIRDNFQGCKAPLIYKDMSFMFDRIHLTVNDIQMFDVIGIQQ